MNQQKKLDNIVENVLSDDLSGYNEVLAALKKRLPFLVGTRAVALALLKEYLGDVSTLDLSTKEKKEKKSQKGGMFFEDIKDGKARLFINIGKNHRMSPGDLIREIVKHAGIEGKQVGKIDIYFTYSFFEVPEQFAEMVLLAMDKTKIRGVTIVVEPARRKNGKK